MSQKNNGYRLGLLTRQKMREHGIENSPVAKAGLAAGLEMLSTLAWFLEDNRKSEHSEYDEKEPLSGYHYSGPEGPGFYYNDKKIDDWE